MSILIGSVDYAALSREELRKQASEQIGLGQYDLATAIATLAITAPSERSVIPPAAYRGVEPERVSAARGDAAMVEGQALMDADASARHGLTPDHTD